ncbi:protein LYK2 [Cucurbita moschata]|uniref:Protein LYK2 n=1 Tax=Cucurbita moschata TaxID=3662 RepID=A0A6J1GUS8_CUCMO|nr:protein LYK2 [Cucurbita moschata]
MPPSGSERDKSPSIFNWFVLLWKLCFLEMAIVISVLLLRALILFIWLVSSAFGESSLSCDSTSPDAFGFHCNGNEALVQCGTFAVLFANSQFSSLFNLSFYLGINQFAIAEINGFSADTELLPLNQPLLIPIECKCNGSFFQAGLTKTAIKGESFYSIAESLEGLTSCRAIKEKNMGVSPWGLGDSARLLIPMRCGCPSSYAGGGPKPRLLISYPVRQGDTLSNLATNFNTTPESIISANSRSLATFKPERLEPFSTLLIPVNGEPILGSLAKPHRPDLRSPSTSIPSINSHKNTAKMVHFGVYIALGGVILGVSIAAMACFLVIKLKKNKQKKTQKSYERGEMELQQLSLSIRTASDKKFSFEGSQDTFDSHLLESNASKMLIAMYTVEEIRRATENFNTSNQIEGSMYQGRLNGKNMAIKRTENETVSKIEFSLLHDIKHPSILRLLGICLTEDPDSFLVFEYAKNGSLKDWLHGGLAMKNQFITSCYCFLTWSQRLRICLDVAAGLQHMHHVMKPVYVHRNVKSRNIFLDEDFNAKIGNFGMARCVQNEIEDPKFCSSNPASWSLGYLAPEYIHQGIISPTIDIFAYGVVLLEILSGKTPITKPNAKGEGSVWLTEKIKAIMESDNAADELREWMDSALGDSYALDAAFKLAKLARSCVEEDHSLRPSAAEVFDRLSRLVEELPEGDQSVSCESSTKPLVKGLQASETNP